MRFNYSRENTADTNENIKINVLLVDPLAEDLYHLIDDDMYLAECLQPLSNNFLVMTSPASIANIKHKLDIPVRKIPFQGFFRRFVRLRLFLVVCTLPHSNFNNVVFQSFEEVSTLLFMLLNPRRRVHLIVTNNLRPDRLKRHPALGRFFLRAIFNRATSVLVHCQYEVERIRQLLPQIDPAKIYIKPFHQMAFPRIQRSFQEKSRTILFVGPECEHKKVAPVIELIKKDKDNRFRYVFCSMKDRLDQENLRFLKEKVNVEILFGYLDPDEYYRLFSEATFVILTHDDNFEGTLSGVFCDAIASGTAVIARDMAPHNEFFNRFGEMGFLVDYTNPEWYRNLLTSDLSKAYSIFQLHMALCRDSSSMNSIRGVFKSVLLRG